MFENQEGNEHVFKISKNLLFGGFAWGVCAASHQSAKGRVQTALADECQEAIVEIKDSHVFSTYVDKTCESFGTGGVR